MRVVIIGAGPTGLGAAMGLLDGGHRDLVVLEGKRYVGGHAASFTTPEGFTFDLGGHVTFSRDRRFLDAVDRALQGRFLKHERRARIYTHQRFVPYPFQNNIASLPPDVAWECLEGLLSRTERKRPRTFREFLHDSFGPGVTKHFMEPYNRKVWTHDLAEMGVDWMADRVSRVSLADVLRPFVFGPESDWGPNATFRYPEAGTGEIYRAMASRLGSEQLELGREVIGIDALRRRVRVRGGQARGYDELISSMPVDRLVAALDRAPRSVRQAASRLVHNQGVFVGVGVRGRSPVDHHWTYFPESAFPFYRVTVLSHYSPALVPRRGVYSLLAEVSIPAARRLRRSDTRRRVIRSLLGTPLMKGRTEQDIVCTWVGHVPYSYPVPTLDRDGQLGVVIPWLEQHGIHSRGRFGQWAYERGNMDHSYLAGAEAARRILG